MRRCSAGSRRSGATRLSRSRVVRDRRLAGVYTENWRRHAHHSIPYQGRMPWRARIRVGWVSLTRRRPTLTDTGGQDYMGEG